MVTARAHRRLPSRVELTMRSRDGRVVELLRWVRASVCAATLLALVSACSSDQPHCQAAHSVDVGIASGQPTARAALNAFVADRPKWINDSGWTLSRSTDQPDPSATFVSGSDVVTVTQSA